MVEMDKAKSYRGADVLLEGIIEGGAYDPQRERVREMRMAGEECKAIAGRMGIPEGQVIVYCIQLGLPVSGPCRTMGLPAEDEAWLKYRRGEPEGRKCPVCGRVLEQPYRGRRRKFCSQRCKDKFWNDRQKGRQEELGREAVCENCGKKFIAVNEKNGERRFCGRDCYFEFRYGKREERGNDGDGE